MVERRDVEFEVEGGDRLRGWLFQPEAEAGPHPAISFLESLPEVDPSPYRRLGNQLCGGTRACPWRDRPADAGRCLAGADDQRL